MKNYIYPIVSLFFFVFTNTIQAQYQSIFGANQTVWKTSNCGALSAPCFLDSTFTTGNDTIINNITFMEMKSIPTGSSSFFLGEDTTTGKLWYKEFFPSGTLTQNIADMTLTVNDTFDFGGQVGKHRAESIYFKNNRKIIRFDETFTIYNQSSTQTTDTLKMIEGVGTNLGVFYQNFYSLGNYLICQEQDSIRVFETNKHPNLDCNLNSNSIKENSTQSKISIHPNPVSNFINLKLNGLASSRIQIVDLKGSVVKSFENSLKKVDVSELKNGTYFLKVYSNEGIITKKIIVVK